MSEFVIGLMFATISVWVGYGFIPAMITFGVANMIYGLVIISVFRKMN